MTMINGTDRHVVLWSDHCLCQRVHEISADAKVAHLNVAAPTEQNVGRLYVAMNHIQLSLEIVQGTQHLREHIHVLREATQLWPDAWVQHFTRYSSNIFPVWWTGSKQISWNFFRIMCTENYLNRLIFDRVFKIKSGRFLRQCSKIARILDDTALSLRFDTFNYFCFFSNFHIYNTYTLPFSVSIVCWLRLLPNRKFKLETLKSLC